MQVSEFIAFVRNEQLEDGIANELGEPMESEGIGDWEANHPEFPLPEAYKELLRHADGMALHATSESPKGRIRLLPLAEVRPLAEQIMEMAGIEEEDLTDPPSCLMVGEDQDSAWCVGMDTASGRFLEVAYTGDSTDLGDMSQFLDWIAAMLANR